MSTYREAIQHARQGGTARSGGKEIRFLTFEEAEPIILDQAPSRAVRRDETGVVIENGKLVIDTFAEPAFDTKRLGLHDVGVHPAAPFSPTDDDLYEPAEIDEEGKEKPRVLRTDWEGPAIEPTVVAPETVDEMLHETLAESPIESTATEETAPE